MHERFPSPVPSSGIPSPFSSSPSTSSRTPPSLPAIGKYYPIRLLLPISAVQRTYCLYIRKGGGCMARSWRSIDNSPAHVTFIGIKCNLSIIMNWNPKTEGAIGGSGT